MLQLHTHPSTQPPQLAPAAHSQRRRWRRRRSLACAAVAGAAPAPAAPRRRRHLLRSTRALPVVATSEFWYEEEAEFDALTEVLQPKRVAVASLQRAAREASAGASGRLADVPFDAAFAAPAVEAPARELWQRLGRAGPPLFLKVRVRAGIGSGSDGGGGGDGPAGFWAEVAGITWRTALDAGLGSSGSGRSSSSGSRGDGGGAAADAGAAVERLLVLTESPAATRRLVAAAVGGSGSSGGGENDDDDPLLVVALTGFNAGEAGAPLTDWHAQLSPALTSEL